MIQMKHGKYNSYTIDQIRKKYIIKYFICNFYYYCRPSLFDDFVEYEILRLKKLDQNVDEETEQESNNNINVL